MREQDSRASVDRPVQGRNWTIYALIGGLVLLVLIFAYFATNRDSDQDKLTNASSTSVAAGDPEKRCASKATYDLIKRELFRRAGQMRGSDQAAFDKLSAYASLRMENPVMESENGKTGAVNCSGSLTLDLPPGVAVVGGRRSVGADVDYTIQPAADGSGMVVMLKNADAIIAPLATLARTSAPTESAPAETNEAADEAVEVHREEPVPAVEPAPPAQPTPPSRPASARPSFDCARARTRGEIAVCSNAGLAALDRTMAAQFNRAMANAAPDERMLLVRTRDRFIGYRDRCPNNACIGDAYTGRMREIRDIMEGRWTPSR